MDHLQTLWSPFPSKLNEEVKTPDPLPTHPCFSLHKAELSWRGICREPLQWPLLVLVPALTLKEGTWI